MKNNYFNEIYDDFFSVKKEELNTNQEPIQEVDLIEEIDNLYLDNESKNLLHQIVNYMNKYSKKEENNYINFNIMVEGNDNEVVTSIASILSKSVKNTHYIENNNVYELSMYELSNKVDIIDIYDKNGIVILKDIKSFLMLDENNKKIFLYNLKRLMKDNITILFGNKEDISMFTSYDSELEKSYFNFRLIEVIPSIQDIYQDVLNKISLDEEKKILLLDYISDSYKEINNYPQFRDKLINYISFHKNVPVIRKTKSIEEVFASLDSLVGLNDVKSVLHDLVNLISLKKKSNLDLASVNLHMLFLGNPGTGKTTVARHLSDILYNLGYIKENKLIEVSSKDLVAEYVGQTAIKTYSVIERAIGGILFIDEAYSLSSKNNSYNDEAIATLIKAMEDNRDNLVVIFAGYTKEMQDFINSNSGIASRIGYTLNFKDYTEDELLEIFKSMVEKAGFKITNEALYKARSIIKENKDVKTFGNARFVRNMYEKTITKHATNTKDKHRKDILITITDKDINIENVI